MMNPSTNCYNLIKSFEGLFLKAYADPIGIWTIGYGTIVYPNGVKVKKGDVITQAQADEYLKHEIDQKSQGVNSLIQGLNQNQFDSLVSFAYNLGLGSLKKSTLLKKAKVNPSDPTIKAEFMKWTKAGGKVLKGLIRRRQEEANLYFKAIQ